MADPSLQIKSGVQWGLFGSAILQLGTEQHHTKWLPGVMDLSIPGAFAMTEIGHGSDVAAVGTTATYDPATEEFVINTPFRGATKEYRQRGAARRRGDRLRAVDHERRQPRRSLLLCAAAREDGVDLPGIGREDDGLKGGLNGIDNGRLSFDHVRIPRTNLLNRYGDVAADGTY